MSTKNINTAPELTPGTALQLTYREKDSKVRSYVQDIVDKISTGQITTVFQLLPMLFMIRGDHYNTYDYFMYEFAFRMNMPRVGVMQCGRQVGKSVTLAVRDLLFCAIRPYTNIVTAFPRMEQTKRFSTAYIRQFLRHSPIGSILAGPDLHANMFQREFSNGSMEYLSYVYLDVDKVRGIAGDMIHCFATYSSVLTPSGFKLVGKDLRAGDDILAFNAKNILVQDVVKRIVYKGVRPTWRVILVNGQSIVCTANERLKTSHGWRTLQQVMNTVKLPMDYEGATLRFDGDSFQRTRVLSTPSSGTVILPHTLCAPNSDRRTGLGELYDGYDPYKPSRAENSSAGIQSSLHKDGAAAGRRMCRIQPHEGDKLIPCDIESIEYVGELAVWDIETAEHHTLVINGFAVHNCDEAQDINPEFEDVMVETCSASKLACFMYSGTPKGMNTLLTKKWRRSSRAAWVTKCDACNHWNIANVANDLLRMIQPKGISCARCGGLINPRTGCWVHAAPDLANSVDGRHVPQPIMPLHYEDDNKWAELVRAKAEMDVCRFYNEKLGEPFDSGKTPLSEEDLKRASTLSHRNNLNAKIDLRSYHTRILATDWGGGGDSELSFTTPVVLGIGGRGTIDVLYMDRFPRTMGDADEVAMMLHIFKTFRCTKFAHDYGGGAGGMRETMLIQNGIPPDAIFNVSYTVQPKQPIVKYHPATRDNPRHYYGLDKPRSLGLLCNQIQNGKFRFPVFESWRRSMDDFLAIEFDLHKSDRQSDTLMALRKDGMSDDTIHAVNFGAFMYWHMSQSFPTMILPKVTIPEVVTYPQLSS